MVKYCPMCGVEIESWETVCNNCWRLLGLIDEATGRDYQQQILESKNVIILIPKIIKVYVPIYYPLSEEKKCANIRKLFNAFCSKCKLVGKCYDCLIYKVMNSILYGYDDGEILKVEEE